MAASRQEPPATLNRQSIDDAAASLARVDPILAAILATEGPPPIWKRPQTYATFVRIILEQQVSLASAKSTWDRLRMSRGGRITPPNVIALGNTGLRQIGFSRQKARYTVALADDIVTGDFTIAGLRSLDDDAVANRITTRLGLGAWSASVYLMMAMLRRDVLPLGDLALAKGLAELDGGGVPDHASIVQRTEVWRPYRSVGVRMVWQSYLSRRGQNASASALA